MGDSTEIAVSGFWASPAGEEDLWQETCHQCEHSFENCKSFYIVKQHRGRIAFLSLRGRSLCSSYAIGNCISWDHYFLYTSPWMSAKDLLVFPSPQLSVQSTMLLHGSTCTDRVSTSSCLTSPSPVCANSLKSTFITMNRETRCDEYTAFRRAETGDRKIFLDG